jgi:ubiquinone/menaquinone biosynthesis C-methylase UbiE
MLVQRNLYAELDTHGVTSEEGLDFAYLGSLHTVLHNVLKTWPVFDVSQHVTKRAISDLQRNPFSETCIPPIPKKKRVLVVGCGRGIHVLDIAVSTSHDVEIVAVDVVSGKVEGARRLLQRFPEVNQRVTLIKGNIHEFTSEHKFDMILDANVIHYMPQPVAAQHVQRMVDLLQENGHLFMFWQPHMLSYPNDKFLKHLQPRPAVVSEWALNEAIGANKGIFVQFKTSPTEIPRAPEIRSVHFMKTPQELK